ncbi:MAG: nicotinamide mononucleotide transporter [Clostridia bacterium]|nr:nicotinamide mononucleotide transporter [Clostridia bacterium]
MNELERIIKSIRPHEAVIYISGYVLSVVSLIISRSGYLEFAASVLFLTGVIFNSRRSRAWFLFSCAGMVFYCITAFHNRFYSEIFIDLFYMVPMQIYGFVNWGRSEKAEDLGIKVERLPVKRLFIYIAAGAGITLVYGYVLTLIGNAAPFAGAAATVCSAIAVMLSARRNLEQFFFWMGNNVCIIAMWLFSLSESLAGLPIIFANAVFVAINLTGFLNWRRQYKKSE